MKATIILICVLVTYCVAFCTASPMIDLQVIPLNVKQDQQDLPSALDTSDEIDARQSNDSVAARCGKDYGVCPDGECCGLHNECGVSTAHCNVSLGCKRKFGRCH